MIKYPAAASLATFFLCVPTSHNAKTTANGFHSFVLGFDPTTSRAGTVSQDTWVSLGAPVMMVVMSYTKV